ncbi:MAG: succinylglutamate desuccinylase/aspartoacylase family protein [Alphaproteobacteria bacterium]|nr:succinylglutamate desuccinylase/aspartoacylase family protein [Alphaproteobacteria bacterium]
MPSRATRVPLLSNSPGTQRFLTVYRFGTAGARPKVYMQAAIHANELPGVMALHHLLPMLDAAEKDGKIKGEIIVVPTANPVGLSQHLYNNHLGRYDFNLRENYNRNFLDIGDAVVAKVKGKLGKDPAQNVALVRKLMLKEVAAFQPPNEPQFLKKVLMAMSVDADYVIDLHCDTHSSLHLFAGASPRDAVEDMSADIGSVATTVGRPDAIPGIMSFSACNMAPWLKLAKAYPDAALPKSTFSVTIEYRGQADVSHALGRSDGANLFRFLQRRGAIGGDPGPLPKAKCKLTPSWGMDVGYAPKPGMLVYVKDRGAKVKAGETVCEIIDPLDPFAADCRTPVKAVGTGVLVSRRRDGQLTYPGQVVFRMACDKELPHRIGKPGTDD